LKRILSSIVFLVSAVSYAQIPSGYVQATATVTALSNGTYGAAWTNLSSSPQLPLLGGISTFQTTVSGTFDGSGHFSVLLADTAQIIPNPSTWTFSFTYNCGPGQINTGFTVQVAVTGGGGTEDISSEILSAIPSNPCAGGGQGGGGASPPSRSVQFSSDTIPTKFQSDSQITINPTTHTQCWGGCPTNPTTVVDGAHVATPVVNFVQQPVQPGVTDICTAIASSIAALPAAGGTVDARGLASLSPVACGSNPFAANNASGSPKPVSVLLGPGKITTPFQWLISTSNMSITGAGRTQTIVQYTGTSALLDPSGGPGGIIEIDSAMPQTTLIQGSRVSDLFISGNSHSPYGILCDGCHRGDVARVSVWNVTNTGIELKFAVGNSLYSPHVTSEDALAAGVAQTQQPANGVALDGEDQNHAATATAINDPIVEFLTGCGLQFTNAFSNVVVSGTSESNGTRSTATTGNVCFKAGGGFGFPTNNTVIGTDLESAVSGESLYVYGQDNHFIRVSSSQQADFYGNQNDYTGGFIGTPVIDSGATGNAFDHVNFNVAATDNGSATRFNSSWMVNPNAYNGFPWESRDTTWNGGSSLGLTYDGGDYIKGQYVFPYNTQMVISTTPLAATHWHAIFSGQFVNNGDGTGMPQLAPWIEISDANSTIKVGGCTITFGITGTFFTGTEGTCSSFSSSFNGRIWVIPGTNNSAGAVAVKTSDAVDAGSFLLGGAQVIPQSETSSQVAGQVACVKSVGPPVVFGTCSGTVNATTGACGTCN
jgi:hypothetical protein